ncbi:unnamed protein product [Choristocarpus tenellus]
MTHVAFLALGSIGDCLPLCALAARLPSFVRQQDGSETVRIAVVTHRCHCSVVRDILETVVDVLEPPEIWPVDIPVLHMNSWEETRPGRFEKGREGWRYGFGVDNDLDACLLVLESIRPRVRCLKIFLEGSTLGSLVCYGYLQLGANIFLRETDETVDRSQHKPPTISPKLLLLSFTL